MNGTVSSALPQVYTPDQVAQMLQLSTNTVYELINRGEIVAKRLGKTLRVPALSLSFAFYGMDADILAAEAEDKKNLPVIQDAISNVRAKNKF